MIWSCNIRDRFTKSQIELWLDPCKDWPIQEMGNE